MCRWSSECSQNLANELAAIRQRIPIEFYASRCSADVGPRLAADLRKNCANIGPTSAKDHTNVKLNICMTQC